MEQAVVPVDIDQESLQEVQALLPEYDKMLHDVPHKFLAHLELMYRIVIRRYCHDCAIEKRSFS